ncbi:MAG TPA: tetratricopeptide repeat protein, partial [Dehalococcoidia bacterium]|nr:tetratricopeptide repeat protein [Dehalococcoidia bacterium]
YTKAIQLEPTASRYTYRGISYYNLEQYQTAINDYTTAIQLDPDYAWAHYIRAFVYRNLGQTAKAYADDAMACSLDSYYC